MIQKHIDVQALIENWYKIAIEYAKDWAILDDIKESSCSHRMALGYIACAADLARVAYGFTPEANELINELWAILIPA